MYNSQEIADRIKSLAKNKHISYKTMLKEIGLGEQTLQNMKSSIPKADNLAKIADYLKCSVDYLLGRTDEVSLNQGSFIQAGNVSGNIIAGDINGDHNANIHTAIPEDVAELVELIQSLPLVKRAEAVIMLNEMRTRGGR